MGRPLVTDASISNDGVRQLLGRGTMYTAARLAQLGGMMLVLPLLTRVLEPDEFGRASIAVVISQIAHLVGSAGLPSAITRRYFEAGGDEAARRLVATTIVAACVAAAVGIAVEPLWSPLVGADAGGLGVIAIVSTVPLAALSAGQALLRAQDNAVGFVTSALISSVGAQASGLVVASLRDQTPSDYLIGLTAGYGIAATVSLVTSGVQFTSPGRDELLSALRFGLPTVAHSVAMYVMNAGDRVVIEQVKGAGEVARYQVIYVVAGLGILLLNSVNNAWSPLIYGAPEESRWTRLRDTSGVVHVIAALLTCCLGIGGPVAVRVLVPANFLSDDLGIICALVAGSAVPYATFIAYAIVLFHERRTSSMAVLTVTVAVVNLALNAVLVPRIGIEGAAWATLLSYIVLGAVIRAIASRAVDLAPVNREEGLAVLGAVLGMVVAGLLPVTDGWLVVRAGSAILCGLLVLNVARARFRAS